MSVYLSARVSETGSVGEIDWLTFFLVLACCRPDPAGGDVPGETTTQYLLGDKTLGEQIDSAPSSDAINALDACLAGPSFNATLCRDLGRQFRAISCSDVAPGSNHSCFEQANTFQKCNAAWMYREAFCLRSCKRCGPEDCVDVVPPGFTECDPALCESALYVGGTVEEVELGAIEGLPPGDVAEAVAGGPWCMKTCRRCSPVPGAVLLP